MERKLDLELDYEVNGFTMAILPFEVEGKLYSKVLEEDKTILIALPPLKIIEDSCNFYSASFEGRKQGTKDVSGYTHKPPIVIDPVNDIFFFPTASATHVNCHWISLHYSYEYRKSTHGNTSVRFPNKMEVELPISPSSYETQVHRTSLFRSKLQQRVNRTANSENRNRQFISIPRMVHLKRK